MSKSQPEKTAVIFKTESLSYKQLYQKALAIGTQLRNMGIQAGDRVCFSAVSKPEMIAVYLGIHVCKAVAVFLDKNATPKHMKEIYQTAGAKLLLTDKPMKEAGQNCTVFSLRQLYAEAGDSSIPGLLDEDRQEEDLAEILFTTGTTGKPKGVMLSYKAVYHILMNTIKGCGYSSETVDRKSTRLNSSHRLTSRMPSSA